MVFKSNSGETDTIFVLKKEKLLTYPEAQSLSRIKYEMISVLCKLSDRNREGSGKSDYLFQVQKSRDRYAELVIDLR